MGGKGSGRPARTGLEATTPGAPQFQRLLGAGTICDICNQSRAGEMAVAWNSDEMPAIVICGDCASGLLQAALDVKMKGMLAQWRAQKAIALEARARRAELKRQQQMDRRVTNAT